MFNPSRAGSDSMVRAYALLSATFALLAVGLLATLNGFHGERDFVILVGSAVIAIAGSASWAAFFFVAWTMALLASLPRYLALRGTESMDLILAGSCLAFLVCQLRLSERRRILLESSPGPRPSGWWAFRRTARPKDDAASVPDKRPSAPVDTDELLRFFMLIPLWPILGLWAWDLLRLLARILTVWPSFDLSPTHGRVWSDGQSLALAVVWWSVVLAIVSRLALWSARIRERTTPLTGKAFLNDVVWGELRAELRGIALAMNRYHRKHPPGEPRPDESDPRAPRRSRGEATNR